MLSKQYRLTKQGSFRYVYNNGQRKQNTAFRLSFVLGKTLKVGIVISKKLGKANKRNLIKRRIRAIFRENIQNIKKSQIVLSVKEEAADMLFKDLRKEVLGVLKKSNLI
ncbi:MAG: ribonuclease P protein component [Firmicutes bacterium]|nr:ribonuclease P protein component [Bacillota bacterium]MCL2255799.1 ribonuclease P protein component [Bacillota bacterium]